MNNSSPRPVVFVSGSFDNLKTIQIRFLQEASKLGEVHVLLYSDMVSFSVTGSEPEFPQAERRYFLESIRFVDHLSVVDVLDNGGEIPMMNVFQDNKELSPIWAVMEGETDAEKRDFCRKNGLQLRVIAKNDLVGFPSGIAEDWSEDSERRKVLVSGCFDWVHSGHVRFFEEVSAFGDLYVIVGHDKNLELLKGENHPLYPQEERLYWVQSIRFVNRALISTGHGWLDAEPEIMKIKPDIFVVNEDGDVPDKRRLCMENNIEYRVLKRTPKEGLPARVSSDLRGF